MQTIQAGEGRPGEKRPPIEKLSYTIPEAVVATSIPRTRIYNDLATGNLKTFKVGRRRFVSRTALQDYVDKLENPPRRVRKAAAR